MAEDLLRDRRGRAVRGVVTNDESLQRAIELERRLGESGGGARAAKLVVNAANAPDATMHAQPADGNTSPLPKKARRNV